MDHRIIIIELAIWTNYKVQMALQECLFRQSQ